jgi:bifunctional DNA-binding transcriptional regulator/antitoxin component of YhaV-PrlF toxin-antitoxin module
MATLQIRSKGTITIPSGFRKMYGLDEGETLTMIDMGNGAFMLSPKASEVERLANNIARQLKEDNVTFEDLLEALDEERERYYKEHYAKD